MKQYPGFDQTSSDTGTRGTWWGRTACYVEFADLFLTTDAPLCRYASDEGQIASRQRQKTAQTALIQWHVGRHAGREVQRDTRHIVTLGMSHLCAI